jgi:glycosyltransferase involved in cell wall biosynthesis
MSWRVLLVSELLPDPQPGGLVRHVLGLADALHRRGCQVDLLGNALHPIANHPDQAGPGRFFGGLRGHQRLWKEGALGCFHPLRTVFTVQGLRAAILAHAAGYDVVHYHGHLPWVGARLPASVPFTQTRHDTSGDCMLKTRLRPGRDDEDARCLSVDPADCAACAARAPNALQRAVSTQAVRHLRARTAAALAQRPVVFVSQHLRAQAERVGAAAPLGTVIHHALPRDELQAAAGSVPRPRDAGVSVQVFGAAALWPYKGFGALLDALAVRELPAGWQLAIAGDGPQRAALQQRHARLPLRWLGWQPHAEVLRLTAAADAVVVPSIWDEPCGATVLEGLALGRVVYALRRGGPPELGVYAGRGADRLRLFDTLGQLADALLSHPGGAVPAAAALAEFSGDTDHLADAVLAHYARHFRTRGG